MYVHSVLTSLVFVVVVDPSVLLLFLENTCLYGAISIASEAPWFSVYCYSEEVGLTLEELKCRLRPNDGGKVVRDGRWGIREALIDNG